jgi:anthranilate synthase component 1
MIETIPRYAPSLPEVRAAHGSARSVAISREIMADLDTPVSAYLKIREAGASFLLESIEGGEQVGRFSFIGIARDVVRLKDGRVADAGGSAACDDPLQIIQTIVEQYGTPAAPGARFEGGALGYLAYESARYFERLPLPAHDPLNLPDAAFMDVDTVLIFDHVRHSIRIVSHAWLDRDPDIAYREAAGRIESLVARLSRRPGPAASSLPSTGAVASNVGGERYTAMVRRGKEYIERGDVLQVVLSQRLSIPVDGDPFALYRRLRGVSPSPYMYYLDFGDHQIVGASPELLLQVEGETVTARPIAGTRRRGHDAAEDKALGDELLADEKERAEHLMLVDLARNDVGRVSVPGSVSVDHFMEVERFSHVMHLVSDVAGRLRPDLTALDALRAAFPAGTVSGAPKIRAMEIIAELEPDRRGPYAGAVGFVNTGGDMEMAITIRTAVIKDGVLYVQAGAGIVADSVPEGEYVETMNKARAMLEAAGASDDSAD